MTLELLESRLNDLERIIFGDRHGLSALSEVKRPIFDQLVSAHNAIASAEKRPLVAKMLARKIQKYTDPNFIEDDTMSSRAKVEILLAEKEKLEDTAVALANIQALAGVLNHPSFKALNDMRKKMMNLHDHLLGQQRKSALLLSESRELLSSYFRMILGLSKLFIHWNHKASSSDTAES
ncbi:unnamed protein product [Dicrocoelium dendriticum]|nr:unnamed protein product [Dicrocoelium dendriticum]